MKLELTMWEWKVKMSSKVKMWEWKIDGHFKRLREKERDDT